ncbi:hypothetical protein FB451DRAFT_1187633 [Mycena latifolia]|nr:hypothetical protein FB451DRAFT_1187633 [Mycena latifolia]
MWPGIRFGKAKAMDFRPSQSQNITSLSRSQLSGCIAALSKLIFLLVGALFYDRSFAHPSALSGRAGAVRQTDRVIRSTHRAAPTRLLDSRCKGWTSAADGVIRITRLIRD